MKTKKRLVSVIVTSCVALCLCAALLAGSTFAWFTDTLVSSGNIIKAGNINIDGTVYYEAAEDGVTVAGEGNSDFTINPIVSTYDMDEDNTSDAIGETGLYGYGERTLSFEIDDETAGNLNEKGAISGTHDEDVALEVEPGKSYARLIKLENTGTIDAVAKFNFSAGGDLADEMWFYLAEVAYDESTGPSLTVDSGATFIPESIDEINDLEDNNLTKEFSLKADAAEDKWLVLVFGVYASAGNDVQGKALDLTMTVLATQDVGHSDASSPVKADYAEWTGVTDTSWYSDDLDEFTLYTPAQLGGLAYLVNGSYNSDGEYFRSKVVKLGADIDLGGCKWTPIGHTSDGSVGYSGTDQFEGDFDGNGYTIYNLDVEPGNGEEKSDIGLFGRAFGGRFENIRIHNAKIVGEKNIGVLLGNTQAGNSAGGTYGSSCVVTDCHVTGLIEVDGTYQVGGLIGGATSTVIADCSVEGISGSHVSVEYDDASSSSGYSAGGIVGCMVDNKSWGFGGENEKEPEDGWKLSGLTVSGLDISAPARVGGILGKYYDNDDGEENGDPIAMENCSVSNCVLTITPDENVTKNPAIGAFIGVYTGEIDILGGNSVRNVRINYSDEEYIGSEACETANTPYTYLLFGEADTSGGYTAKIAYGTYTDGGGTCAYEIEIENLVGYLIV